MKSGLTELVFILDKSGSMSGLEADTIGGFNSMLEKQKAVLGECCITTVLFAHDYELLHDRIDIRGVRSISEREYQVGGNTALLDAIGKAIHKVSKVQKNTAEEFRAEKVLFVIITDGEENASREYSAEMIKERVEHKKKKYGWEFIFLGANIDAVAAAHRFGIAVDRAQDFHPDREGLSLSFMAMSDAVSMFREESAVPLDWNAALQQDFKRRGRRK
ncbi:MAG: VWA domain-containing protein [Firmicutes bacterium]|nr:VWA domain-containing protein [Dethiobacter sp.]MBS3888496.1 VWA domain-containing protein [Bacillota bacterium]MBS4055600.1 VWA domain-containing protein [Thermaerobacter sp.]